MSKSGSGTGTGTGAAKKGKSNESKRNYTVSEKALAQRRKYSPIANQNKPFEGEDIQYNARHIEHILRIHEIASHANIKDPASLKSCFINYLLLCEQDGFKVGNLAACAAMGVDRRTVNRWIYSEKTEYRELAEFVKLTCSISREGLIADQKINPVIGIFWQRNFDGLRNDTELQQNNEEQNETETETAGDYYKKYGRLLEE